MSTKSFKIKVLLGLSAILFLTAGILAGINLIQTRQNFKEYAAPATNLYFDPGTLTNHPGDNITFILKMDTGENNVIGLDLLLKFNPESIQVTSIQPGSGVTNLNNTITKTFNNTSGTVSYIAFTLDKMLAVNGSSVEILKINATVDANVTPGSYAITFDPTTAISATNEATNVLTGASNGTLVISPIPSDPPSPSPTPIPTVNPTNPPGAPNSCGGTCGSNANCAGNLFCFQGYCRNADCATRTDCNCITVTPVPTPVPTPTKTPTPVKTPVKTKTPTPIPTTSPFNEVNITPRPLQPTPTVTNFWENIYGQETPVPPAEPTSVPIQLPEAENDTILPWIIGSLIVGGITLVLIAIGIFKQLGWGKKSKPPIIKI